MCDSHSCALSMYLRLHVRVLPGVAGCYLGASVIHGLGNQGCTSWLYMHPMTPSMDFIWNFMPG